MNKENDKLHEDYSPFEELQIGGNNLHNVRILFKFKGHIPLLIGKGTAPQIWLSIPLTKDGSEWKEVVAKNKSLDERITVVASEEKQSVLVKADTLTIIHVKKVSNEKAEVISFNLKPVGFSANVDTSGLKVGPHLFINNSFSNIGVMISIE